jgi:hypothetical protein
VFLLAPLLLPPPLVVPILALSLLPQSPPPFISANISSPLHQSADDSLHLASSLNGMPQNGKCLVNFSCDSWSMVFPGAVESVEGP